MAVNLKQDSLEDEIIANKIIDMMFGDGQKIGEDEEEEKQRFVIDSDEKAAWALKKIENIDKQFERFKKVAEGMIKELEQEIEKEKLKWLGERNVYLKLLREYFESLEEGKQEQETQIKYKLPYGALILKKPKFQLKCDKKIAGKWAKENGCFEEFIKEEPQLQWGQFKKRLEIKDGNTIIDTETGEVLDIPGIEIERVPEAFDVKF
ncbi:MAG: host-nuclease inhibitor Gam family protein [Thermosipho sp. (in: Bacteria)]|nr:host-nuclease inhibitor Gam family protein [Thermosipho sp. (in: thermotogales)]